MNKLLFRHEEFIYDEFHNENDSSYSFLLVDEDGITDYSLFICRWGMHLESETEGFYDLNIIPENMFPGYKIQGTLNENQLCYLLALAIDDSLEGKTYSPEEMAKYRQIFDEEIRLV